VAARVRLGKPMKPLAAALLLLSLTAALPSAYQATARRFMTNFAANRLDDAALDFNEQMKATVTPAVLTKFKQQFERDLGPFHAVTVAREGLDGNFPMIELTAQFEKGPALVQVTFDPEGRIGALHFGRPTQHNAYLEKLGRDVLDAFNNRRFEQLEKYFDMKMSAQLPPSALESLHDDVTAVYGAFKSVTKVEYTTQRDLRVVDVHAEYEKAPMLFEVVFNAAGRVVGWSFRPPRSS
jgi:hypothetical protein